MSQNWNLGKTTEWVLFLPQKWEIHRRRTPSWSVCFYTRTVFLGSQRSKIICETLHLPWPCCFIEGNWEICTQVFAIHFQETANQGLSTIRPLCFMILSCLWDFGILQTVEDLIGVFKKARPLWVGCPKHPWISQQSLDYGSKCSPQMWHQMSRSSCPPSELHEEPTLLWSLHYYHTTVCIPRRGLRLLLKNSRENTKDPDWRGWGILPVRSVSQELAKYCVGHPHCLISRPLWRH